MISSLAARVLALPAAGHPVRVGIDGRCAAGKTTLADALAERLRSLTGREVIRAELDHFMVMVEDPNAHPYDSPESFYLDSWDYPAIRRLLLEPLGAGGDRRYRTAPIEPSSVAADDAILIADGVFLQRPELHDLWDLRIYLDISLEESFRRGVERDQHWMGPEASSRYRNNYLPAEQRYEAEVTPRLRAHVVVDMTP